MKELISKYGEPKAFNGRYMCAYSNLAKPMWWDTKSCGGPIIEQATHFCDLARFLCGEIDFESVRAIAIKQHHLAGQLSRIPENINEETIPQDRRIPRVTNAFWKFANGAIGTLMHGVLLHENKYETEIELWGDGYRMVLSDPYGACRLSVRGPNNEDVIVEEFGGEDAYYEEDRIFIEAILDPSRKQHIQSPYHDAVNTYKLTWLIAQQTGAQ